MGNGQPEHSFSQDLREAAPAHDQRVPSCSAVAIIPARGGSKGIPRKNLIPIGNQPLVSHAIDQAKRSMAIDRVCVSTDDPEIKAVSITHGAEVIDRPTMISGDEASSESALMHALNHLANEEGYRPDIVVFIQATSPLIQSTDISGIVECLIDSGADSAVAVAPFHRFVWRLDEHGVARGVNHDPALPRQRRQDREPEFVETGAVYAFRRAAFLAEGHRFCGQKTVTYIMPEERSLEIDSLHDVLVVEAVMRALRSGAEAK